MNTWRIPEVPFDDLNGQTIKSITGVDEGSDEVFIETTTGNYMLYHEQDCCEHVSLSDFEYDGNLEGGLIIRAEEVCNGDVPEGHTPDEYESETWTFYKLDTTKGELFMRWLGSSNGYYSESVSFKKIG
jgi:hypothetical protein